MALPSRIKKIFSGTSHPFLPWLAQHLIARYQRDSLIDMSTALLVLPGGNAMRRLMVLLVLEAEDRGSVLIPPEIITTGSLIDRLILPTRSVASEVSRMAAWVEALRRMEPDQISLLVPQAPADEDARGWLALAERVDALHVEVSGSGLSFGDVAQRGAQLASFLDEERWQILEEISKTYEQILLHQGYVCRYRDRLTRISEAAEIPVPGELYLAGIVDLNAAAREFLSRCRGEITTLIFAEEAQASGFDQFGALDVSYWEDALLPLENRQLRVVESPRDVVGALYEALQEYSPDYAQRDITIGVGDETQIAYLSGTLNDLGVEARSSQGPTFTNTEAGFFIAGAARYLGTRTFQHFSAIIRHPYFSSWLSSRDGQGIVRAAEMVQLIDRYQERHFQAIISDRLPREHKSDDQAVAVVEQLHVLLEPVMGPPRTLHEWAGQIMLLIDHIRPSFNRGSDEVIETMIEVLQEFSDAGSTLELRGAEALDFFLGQLEKRAQIADWREQGIELMGWLELALDDAPVLILTGLDEGTVPAVINADPFLPNTLRTHLGLTDNARRLARDKYLFLTMLHSKQSCLAMVARRTLAGDASFPSRLLLACAPDDLADRIELLYQEGKQYQIDRERFGLSPERFLLSAPAPLAEKIETMSVTAFKDYMQCPYRFYLKHVAQVRACDDDLVELDSSNFGTLAHQVLYYAGKDPAIHSHDADKIFLLFDGVLTGLVQKRYGAHEFPAIRVQIEQLRERLKHFSRWQAMHASEGWKIIAIERDILPDKCLLEIDDITMGIRGRIDRVDFHQSSNRYLIFDYKTGERGKGLKSVFGKSGWTDLQMPLYYHAARTFIPEASIEFAYVNLSARITDEQVAYIPLGEKELDAGLAKAREIARSVHDGVFWPPTVERGFDAYDWVLGLNQDEDLDAEGGESDEP